MWKRMLLVGIAVSAVLSAMTIVMYGMSHRSDAALLSSCTSNLVFVKTCLYEGDLMSHRDRVCKEICVKAGSNGRL